MTCLQCGKKIPLIRRWSDQRFCCDEHRDLHSHEAAQYGLARLLENPAPAKFAEMPPVPLRAPTADGLAHTVGELRFGDRLSSKAAVKVETSRPPAAPDPDAPRLAPHRYYGPVLDLVPGQPEPEIEARPFRRQGPVWTFPPVRPVRLAPPRYWQADADAAQDDPACQATWWPDAPRWAELPRTNSVRQTLPEPLPKSAAQVSVNLAPAGGPACLREPSGGARVVLRPSTLPEFRHDAIETKDVGAAWEPRAPAPAVACPPAPQQRQARRRSLRNAGLRLTPAPAANSLGAPFSGRPAAAGLVAPGPIGGFEAARPGEFGLPLPGPRLPELARVLPAQAPVALSPASHWPPPAEALPVPAPGAADSPARLRAAPIIARFTLTRVRLPGLRGSPDLFFSAPAPFRPKVEAADRACPPASSSGGWLGKPVALPQPVAARREPMPVVEEAPACVAEASGPRPLLAPAAAGAVAAADIPATPISSLPEAAPAEADAKAGRAGTRFSQAAGIFLEIRRHVSGKLRTLGRYRRRWAAALRRVRPRPDDSTEGNRRWKALRALWHATPAYARGFVLVVPLMVPTLFYARLQSIAPPAASLASLREAIRARATILIEDQFRDGLNAWSGEGAWRQSWKLDQSGSALPGSLAVLDKSRGLTDYRLEFGGQIETRAMSFVVRAADNRNYHAIQFVIAKPGPLPVVHVIRYAVVDGKAGPRSELPIPLALRPDTLYQVTANVKGDQFIVSVNGQIVDTWIDPLHPVGGVGFFSEKGSSFRLRWVRVVDKDDFLGWLCSQFSLKTADSISSR